MMDTTLKIEADAEGEVTYSQGHATRIVGRIEHDCNGVVIAHPANGGDCHEFGCGREAMLWLALEHVQ